MKNHKQIVTSLKKAQNKNKIANGISFYPNPKRDSVYLLPNIDKKLTNTMYYSPTSLLTKYITEHAQQIIKRTEEDMRKPIILKNMKKTLKSISPFQKGNKILKNIFMEIIFQGFQTSNLL